MKFNLLILSAFVSLAAVASNWTGGKANWSTVSDGASAGWDIIPNGVGAVAQFYSDVVRTVSCDQKTGITIGSLIYSTKSGGKDAGDLTFSQVTGVSTNFIFDADGSGEGYAEIRNQTTKRISLSSNKYEMHDDLHFVNEVVGSAGNTYSIGISGSISGAGNLVIDNVVNDLTANPISLTGSSRFSGNVLIKRGAVVIGTNSLGPNNPVSFGETNGEAVTLILSGTTCGLANQIAIPSGLTGLAIVHSRGAKAGCTHTVSGTVAMESPMVASVDCCTTNSTILNTLQFTGVISGAGSLTTRGPGVVKLCRANIYAGGTVVESGTLEVGSAVVSKVTCTGALGTGDVAVRGGTLSIQVADAIADTATLNVPGDAAADTLVISDGLDERVKCLVIGGKMQKKGVYGAVGSGAANEVAWISGAGTLTALEGAVGGMVMSVR